MTPELLQAVKTYLEDEREFSAAEVAALTGTSVATINRVRRGEYDHISEEYDLKNITTIPFDRLENMLKCEQCITEIFAMAIESDKDSSELYFPRHYLNNVMLRYFPDKFAIRLKEVKNETYA